jgi:hypothetical protein
VKIYSCRSHYTKEFRRQINTVTRVLWRDRPKEETIKTFGEWVKTYQFENEPSQADICILTFFWYHYVAHGIIDQAEREYAVAQNHHKPLVVFNEGDPPAKVPLDDVILFEYGGYRSTPGLHYHSAQPSFIQDYLQIYCQGELKLRPKQEVPVVGFCGQASTSLLETIYRTLRLKWKQYQYGQGRLQWEPPPFETSTFRKQVLKHFENQAGIQTNFILRKRYQAGEPENKSPHHPAKLEFVNNILNSDYTICMRGGGNFSVRFYETLCLGRIPIFIDTDCLLPFQDEIDYKAHISPGSICKDLLYAAEIRARFPRQAYPHDDFIDLQKSLS